MTDSRLQAQAKLVKVEQANDDMERSVRMMEMTAEQSQSRLDDATENEAFLQGEMEEKVEMINHLEGAMKGPLLVGRLPALATPLPHVPPWSRSSSQRATLPLTPPPPPSANLRLGNPSFSRWRRCALLFSRHAVRD